MKIKKHFLEYTIMYNENTEVIESFNASHSFSRQNFKFRALNGVVVNGLSNYPSGIYISADRKEIFVHLAKKNHVKEEVSAVPFIDKETYKKIVDALEEFKASIPSLFNAKKNAAIRRIFDDSHYKQLSKIMKKATSKKLSDQPSSYTSYVVKGSNLSNLFLNFLDSKGVIVDLNASYVCSEKYDRSLGKMILEVSQCYELAKVRDLKWKNKDLFGKKAGFFKAYYKVAYVNHKKYTELDLPLKPIEEDLKGKEIYRSANYKKFVYKDHVKRIEGIIIGFTVRREGFYYSPIVSEHGEDNEPGNLEVVSSTTFIKVATGCNEIYLVAKEDCELLDYLKDDA